MKTVLSLLICVLLFANAHAIYISHPGEVATMRILENSTGKGTIVITYDNGDQEVLQLKGLKGNFESNSALINQKLNDVVKKGYSFVSISTGSSSLNSPTAVTPINYITTYVFVKE